jgi:phage head maturation protease
MADDEAIPELLTTDVDAQIEIRDLSKREIGIRIVPWDTIVNTPQGLEEFKRGAFDGLDPARVVLRMDHQNPPAGKGLTFEDRADGAYMSFRVSATARGDEILTLASDGVATGASVGFFEVLGGTDVLTRSGRRLRSHRKADLREVSTTWLPTYEQAAVQYVRSQEPNTESAPMADQEAPVAGAPDTQTVDLGPITAMITAQNASFNERFADFKVQLEERTRADFTIPSTGPSAELDIRAKRGDWMQAVLKMLSGERVNDLQMRELADLVTGDNVGVVPDAFSTELIGIIDPSRPFLQSTRKLDLPNAGMSLVVPKIVTRPTTGIQSVYGDESQPEKSDVTSTQTSITNVTFDAITIAGGGDISLQLLKRSSPSYLSLFLELLAEAYGANAEAEALDSLLSTVGAGGGVNNGGTLDPEALVLSGAWQAGAAVKKPITNIWLSSAAVGAFIDAKATASNAPLYSSIQAGFTAGAGPAGTISGLRPVYVPTLDATGYDVLVGPSSGFGWTEDGTYTLQVDVPAKAGRDVALVGILWFAPMYPTAFTAYAIGS